MYKHRCFSTRFSIILLLALLTTILGCTGDRSENNDSSDTTIDASELASKVLLAMGGEESWNSTRYFYWDFFGSRQLLWDKWTGNVRIESPRDSTTYLVNINTESGQVMKNGVVMTNPDSIMHYVDRAKRIWINDSYWLVMPFKLKDPGVNLNYLRNDTTLNGIQSYVLELTFEKVGVTPNNKYEVFIDRDDFLVKQWSYFETSEQESADAIWPWDNYQKFGSIMLSSDRSDGKGPRDARVFEILPDSLFTHFTPLQIDLYRKL